MKLFQFLIVLCILTVSASVYAMGVQIQPFSFNLPAKIQLIEKAPVIKVKKESALERKTRDLAEMRRYSRLLATSS